MVTRLRRTHDVAPREGLDRGAFVMAFLLGVFGGVVLKVIGVHPFVAAGYSALVICLYAIAAWAGGRIKIEPETIGDNCYYLGFLFTLASLAYTLYQMATPVTLGEKPIEIPEVISGFGVALSSTIMGVFLRVLLMQMRVDFVAKDREVRADINQSYADFKKNMSGIMAQMKAFSTESIQLASERDERLRQSTEQFVKDHHEALVGAADTLSTNMEKQFSEVAKKAIQKISASVQESNKLSEKALLDLVDSIQKVKLQLKEQEANTFEQIQNRRKLLISELAEAEKRLKAYDAEMLNFIEITHSAADVMSKQVVPALDAFSERLNALPEKDATYFDPEEVKDLEDVVDHPFTVAPEKGFWGSRKP